MLLLCDVDYTLIETGGVSKENFPLAQVALPGLADPTAFITALSALRGRGTDS